MTLVRATPRRLNGVRSVAKGERPHRNCTHISPHGRSDWTRGNMQVWCRSCLESRSQLSPKLSLLYLDSFPQWSPRSLRHCRRSSPSRSCVSVRFVLPVLLRLIPKPQPIWPRQVRGTFLQVSKSELFCLAAVYAFVLLLPLCLLIEAWRFAPLSHTSSKAVFKWLGINGIVSFLNQYMGLSVLDAMSSPLSRICLHILIFLFDHRLAYRIVHPSAMSMSSALSDFLLPVTFFLVLSASAAICLTLLLPICFSDLPTIFVRSQMHWQT